MESVEVINVYKQLQENGIEIWIDGGWGIDVLLGEQTRSHNDLDIAVDHKNVDNLQSLLNFLGYKKKEDKASTEWNFVLTDSSGHEIDIHVFEFDENGNNTYGIEYPKQSLTGTGIINGQTINCIAPEYIIKFHGNYEPKEKDLQDIKALCKKYNLKPPENYRNKL